MPPEGDRRVLRLVRKKAARGGLFPGPLETG